MPPPCVVRRSNAGLTIASGRMLRGAGHQMPSLIAGSFQSEHPAASAHAAQDIWRAANSIRRSIRGGPGIDGRARSDLLLRCVGPLDQRQYFAARERRDELVRPLGVGEIV